MNEPEFDLLPDQLKKEMKHHDSVVFTRHQSLKNADQADTSDEEGVDAEQQKEMEKAKEEQKVAEELCRQISQDNSEI